MTDVKTWFPEGKTGRENLFLQYLGNDTPGSIYLSVSPVWYKNRTEIPARTGLAKTSVEESGAAICRRHQLGPRPMLKNTRRI